MAATRLELDVLERGEAVYFAGSSLPRHPTSASSRSAGSLVDDRGLANIACASNPSRRLDA